MKCVKKLEQFSLVKDTESPKAWVRNILLFTVMFSLNHSCVTSVIDLASSNLALIGAYQSGTLFAVHTFCLLVSPMIVQKLGLKLSLISAPALLCVYISSNIITSFPVFELVGAALGGVGAAYLWTAQGTYFTLNAWEYARSMNITAESATAKLSGVWVAAYALVELLLKFGLGALSQFRWHVAPEVYQYIFLSGCGAVSVVGLMALHPLKQRRDTPGVSDEEHASLIPQQSMLLPNKPRDPNSPAHQSSNPIIDLFQQAGHSLGRMAAIYWWDSKMVLLLPAAVSYAFSMAFIVYFMNGKVLKVALNGSSKITYFTGFSAGVQIILGPLMSYIAHTVSNGRTMVVLIGCIANAFVGIPFILSDMLGIEIASAPLTIDSPRAYIYFGLIYASYGIGSAMTSGIMMATYADFFHYDVECAFAIQKFSSGIASVVAFFIYPIISPSIMALVCATSAGLAFVGFVIANGKFKTAQEEDDSFSFTREASSIREDDVLSPVTVDVQTQPKFEAR